MADVGTTPIIPNPAPPAAPQGTLPGTNINIPIGAGVEGLTVVAAPFRTNAPPWYTPKNTVWSAMGCAVPQAGRYMQTNNNVIFETINEMGKALFEILWKYTDRAVDATPSLDVLTAIYTMLIDARRRLANNAIADAEQAPLPAKFTTAPQMFLVYPVPFYGPLGCVNQWMHRAAGMTFAAMTEAMQHNDNELSFHTTKDFFTTVNAPLKYLLVDMATRYFGATREAAMDPNYLIPATAFASFSRSATGQTNSATAVRPPMGYHPTNLDLEVIRGIPYSQAVGFLQHWPDASLLYSSGGIWNPTSVPNVGSGRGATVGTQFGVPMSETPAVRPALTERSGPPLG